MTEISGFHLIDGAWTGSRESFTSTPNTGAAQTVSRGGKAEIDAAAKAAEAAFPAFAASTRAARAAFLDSIADEIESAGPLLTAHGSAETGLPAARLEGERGRTCGQLRLFASHIRKRDYLDRRHDPALPDRAPLPRPDLRMIQRPVGPVGVFGASNFPLAFSTAGGDTASALAAGCPVIVKGHPGHPVTSEIVARAIDAARRAHKLPVGVFQMVQSDTVEAGAALVAHPLIQAVGFTGSLRGGKALFDIAIARPVPIPFFGELGSVNPVFVLAEAGKSRAAAIGAAWAGSLTMGVGQFCTNPGILIVADANADALRDACAAELAKIAPQVMLNDAIAAGYRAGLDVLAGKVTEVLRGDCGAGRMGAPGLYETTAAHYSKNPDLSHEVFGPSGLIVRVTGPDDMLALAHSLDGQLTCTLQMDAADTQQAGRLLPVLERKAGRILANGWPTGVEVADAMVHGGPYPASTNFGATSVGTMAIRRFLRPVCYQDIPETLLPEDLRS